MAIIDPFAKQEIKDPMAGGIVDPFAEKAAVKKDGAIKNYGAGTIEAAINFLDIVPRAAAGGVAGTVGALAKQDPDAFVDYFQKVMEKTALPETEWGKTVSHVLQLPFEYLDKGAEMAGSKVQEKLTGLGYSPEFSATMATALHTTIDALPMIYGAVKGKQALDGTKKAPPVVPELKEKVVTATPKGPIEFEKVDIPKIPQDFQEYRKENGIDVADFLAERRSENLTKDIKAREEDSAWEHYQKQHDSSISKNDAWSMYEEHKARGFFAKDHEFNPQQGSKQMEKTRFKGGTGKRGYGQGGAVDPAVFKEGIKKLASFFTITDPKLKQVRQSLDDEMYTNYQMKGAVENTYNQTMKDMRDQGLTSETQQKLVHYYEGSIKDLSQEEHKWYQEAFLPAMDMYKNSLSNALKEGGKDMEFNEGVFPRFALDKGGFLDRLLEGSRQGMGGLQGRYATTPSAMKGRSVFALEKDGHRQVVTLGKNNVLTAWENGKPEVIAKFDGKLKPGMEFEDGRKLTQATLKEASDHTDVKYFQDGVEGLLRKAAELQAYTRELSTLNNIKNDPRFESFAKHEDAKDIPDNYRHLKTPVPQLRDYKFEPHIAETLEDYLTPGPEGILPKAFELANNAVIKSLFLVPLPHIANEGLHWIPERGWGWVTPDGWQRLNQFSKPAIESVLKQDKLQKDIALNGGSPLYTRVANEMYWKSRVKESLKDLNKTPGFSQLAKDIGMAPKELYNLISDTSSKTMWSIRDMMYTEAIMEKQAQGMDLKAAIKEVERHMPNYRIPNRVMGSRSLAKVMKNPLVSVFSYYHYGMAKSFTEFGKSAVGTPKERMNAIGQMAVLGTLYYLLYPEMDKFLSKVSGKPLKMRRAGGTALMENIGKVTEGEKAPQDIVRSLVTPSPMLQIPIEVLFNRELFTGQKIYDPSKKDKGKRLAEYVGKQITPIRTAMQPMEGKKSVEDTLLEYFGDVRTVDEQKELRKKLKKALEEVR